MFPPRSYQKLPRTPLLRPSIVTCVGVEEGPPSIRPPLPRVCQLLTLGHGHALCTHLSNAIGGERDRAFVGHLGSLRSCLSAGLKVG
eukprot:scaffold7958_cov430-Prasinococcus_capsulatus_cf.AAC.3